ncbi:MAG TPA: SRPBCC domain-containing protein [Ohtaekwangia sp.]|uniref:SRPBCC family protein n=1 Tax=Ohtaekwangia sp. TaxID=2066019 RepID=UPI002F95D01D
MGYNWSKFTKRVSINSDTETIYTCWATPQGLESWFLRLAAFTKPGNVLRDSTARVQAGDTYRWLWYGYGDDTAEYGEVLEANGKDRFRFTFSGGCIVTMRIIREQNETLCELTQENIPLTEQGKVDYHLGCMKGWTFYLTNLKSILEGGIDLRNKNENLHDVINA